MKALPIVTLALCAAFLGLRQFSISKSGNKNAALKARVEKAKASGLSVPEEGSGVVTATKSPRGRGAGGDGDRGDGDLPKSVAEIDLQELVDSMLASRTGGMPNIKAMMRIQSLILEATPEELEELIRRTGELDAPTEIKQRMIGEFVSGLADEDPRAALQLAFQSEHLDLERNVWRFSNAFAKWASEDPIGAVAWYDAELAKGSFDAKALGRHQAGRVEFEAAAIGGLLKSDFASARDRLLNLEDSERRKVLGRHELRRGDDGSVAHAELVRSTLPEEERAEALAEANRDFLRRKDYDELVEYTGQINATAAEHEAIVSEAVKRKFERFGREDDSPDPEDISEMQSFLSKELPDSADEVTGAALARYGNGNSGDHFTQAVELLQAIDGANPSDQVLYGFLESTEAFTKNRDAALELAAQIDDETQRQAMLDRFQSEQ